METNEFVESARNVYSSERYAMYLRKSRADLELEALGEGETLARHRERLFALAAKHNIHPDQIDVYHELVSGESIQERPEMQRLLSNVYAKKYKGVLVVEVERLARGNTKDQGEVADAFQYSGTHIVTPSKIYNPNDEFDQEYFEFGLFMSRREYKTITRRMSAGKEQAVKEGNYVSNAKILGYDIVRTSKKDRYLVINEEEAKIVRMIFNWFTEDGKASGWIARELTKMGIPTVKGNKEWNRGTVRDMLDNPHYIGQVRWNRAKTIKEFDPATGKFTKIRKRTYETEVYPGKHKAIISVEQFEKALSRCRKNPPVKGKFTLINPLAGILECADCGKKMGTYNNQKNSRTIRIVHAQGITCKKKSLPLDDVIEALVDALKAYEADFEDKAKSDSDQTEMIRHQEKLEALEAELAKQEKRRKNMFDNYDDGAYTKEEFIERKQSYNRTIDALKAQIKETKESAPEPVDYMEKAYHLHQCIDYLKDPDLDAKEKNDFLKQYIDCIKYDAIDYGRNKGGKVVLDVFVK